ncbi:MAG: lytic transglycosylase domain-containing protein [Arenimonas sp.]|nr:lytic transglycosylase domain-containing protein [Arenimonas sp.]
MRLPGGMVLTCLLALICLPAYGDAPDPSEADLKRSGGEVFKRIAQSLDPQSCTPKAAQSQWMKQYIHNPARFQKQLIDMLPILDHVSYQTREQGLPMEFALIPFVESRFQPKAVAKGGPTGLWQLMPSTASHFGLRIGGKRDGRYSVFASTDAALEYLGRLQKMFGHWQTSIMAYNTGDSRMRSSLKRQHLTQADADRRLPTGLAPHTYAYVKKIQALSCFFLDAQRFGVTLPRDAEFMPMASDQDPPILDNGN